jgi:deazaflavin-dependent oxidoreductase (nitroreductase family)
MANDWNQKIIEEFRATGGQVGGGELLLLHTTGAKTGKARVHPVMYQADGDRLVVFASKGGAPRNPDWYHNLRAHPKVSVEVGKETLEVTARVARGQERQRIWNRQKALYPTFAEYERTAGREIPVVILERAA